MVARQHDDFIILTEYRILTYYHKCLSFILLSVLWDWLAHVKDNLRKQFSSSSAVIFELCMFQCQQRPAWLNPPRWRIPSSLNQEWWKVICLTGENIENITSLNTYRASGRKKCNLKKDSDSDLFRNLVQSIA